MVSAVRRSSGACKLTIRPGNLVETAGTAALTGKMSKVIRPQCSSNRHRQIARAGLQKVHSEGRSSGINCTDDSTTGARRDARRGRACPTVTGYSRRTNLIHGRRTVCLKTQRISSPKAGTPPLNINVGLYVPPTGGRRGTNRFHDVPSPRA